MTREAVVAGTALDLVASAEPAIVFSSLAERSVRFTCDMCTVDIDDDGAEYRIQYPCVPVRPPETAWRSGLGHVSAPPRQSRDSPQFGQVHPSGQVVVPFAGSDDPAYRGVVMFGWVGRPAMAGDHLVARLLVEHAVRTVAWQRTEKAVHHARNAADQLVTALNSSRRIGAAIGILMSVYRIPESRALATLRQASQLSNRKLHDLAADVVDTGWLDPAYRNLVQATENVS